jgi:hypothetical protein
MHEQHVLVHHAGTGECRQELRSAHQHQVAAWLLLDRADPADKVVADQRGPAVHGGERARDHSPGHALEDRREPPLDGAQRWIGGVQRVPVLHEPLVDPAPEQHAVRRRELLVGELVLLKRGLEVVELAARATDEPVERDVHEQADPSHRSALPVSLIGLRWRRDSSASPQENEPVTQPSITWPQALAWRMRRHQLDPIGPLSVPDVVGRLCGVQAQVASSAELAVRLRRQGSQPGEVGTALSDGRLVKTWAMRGALHLLKPEAGVAQLSVIASGRSWERPSWQRYFGMTPDSMEALRGAVREALEGTVLTREELIEAVVAQRGLEHIGDELRSGWGTLLKPLAWQGDLCFGPNRGQRVTFMRPEAASSRWPGIPDPDEAGPQAIAAYLGAYGPAAPDAFGTWLSGGYFGKRQLRRWFDELGDRIVRVDIEGQPAVLLAEDVDELASTKPTDTVRLLGGFDQWVLGPGTSDTRVIPAGRRSAVSKQSGWIAPIVVSGGVVTGTWELDRDQVRVGWFREAGKVPKSALGGEVERLSSILERNLTLAHSLV